MELCQVLAKLPVLRVSFAAILKSLPQFLEITVIVLIFVFSFSIVFVTEYGSDATHLVKLAPAGCFASRTDVCH